MALYIALDHVNFITNYYYYLRRTSLLSVEPLNLLRTLLPLVEPEQNTELKLYYMANLGVNCCRGFLMCEI